MPDRPSHPYGLDPYEDPRPFAPSARPEPAGWDRPDQGSPDQDGASPRPSGRRAARNRSAGLDAGEYGTGSVSSPSAELAGGGSGPGVPASSAAASARSRSVLDHSDAGALGFGTSGAGEFSPVPAEAGSGEPEPAKAGRRGSAAGLAQPSRPESRRARRTSDKVRRSRRPHLIQAVLATLAVFAVLGGVAITLHRSPGSEATDATSAIASTSKVTELPSASNDSTPAVPATPGSPAAKVKAGAARAGNVQVGGIADAAGSLRKAADKVGAATVAKAAAKKAKSGTGKPGGAGGAQAVKLGVFRGTSPSEVNSFGQWLGRKVDYASDFSTRTTWDEIANPTYMLQTWKGSGYRMVYATAMLPTQDDSATMAQGAQGAYDQYYKTLAQNLVAYDQGDSIIRLGWEFNLGPSRWHPDTKAHFIAYWQHIVKAMRSVPGTENLQFDWNPNIGGETYDSRDYYPGNAYVDYIGVDIYDISWADGAYPFPADCDAACKQQRREVAWDDKLNGTFGLNFYADFARSKGKPLALPEWGLWQRPDGHGGGDNPYFIQQMYKFIDDPANNVGYQSYFEFDPGDSGDHALTTLNSGGSTFRDLLGH